MSTTSDEQAKTRAARYKWTGLVVIVVAILGYAIITDSPVKSVSGGGVEVTFGVRPVDARPGPTTYRRTTTPNASKATSEFEFAVPGEEPLPFSQVDRIIVEPGSDDPQNRHLELVSRALNSGQLDRQYEESDRFGRFSLWLTNSQYKNRRKVVSYITRLVRRDGSIEIAMRQAYLDGGTWMTQVAPDLLELLEIEDDSNNPSRLDKPQIRSVAEILRALESERYRLVRGQINANTLLKQCFFDGNLTDEDIHQAERQGKTLAVNVGITREAAYAVAEFGFGLYQEEEYLGSKIFWETMVLLNPEDGYFHNMLGASLEGLNRLEPALREYEKALEIDPESSNARKNFERLQARLGEKG